MPLKLDVRRKLLARSDRVKCTDLHPTENWLLVALYSGNVHVWNHESQQLVKTFEVCEVPVRSAKFIARKNWIITGADDTFVRVFNYNTSERVHSFEAHSDYIRCIVVHPTAPYVLTSSDDMLIKLWNWDKGWSMSQCFEGHTHYVMQVVFNPKDNNTFASASLDRTVKVWQLGSSSPNFTLEGHEKGVNCVDYCHSGDKPYLISGADDRQVRIWDFQTKTCVQTLEGHAQNVSCVCYHPELPIIITGAEDGTLRVWHINTYRLEQTLNYGLDRVWTISAKRGTNEIAAGYDEGTVMIKLGREEPAMSMDTSGKIVWARHSEFQQVNLKALGAGAAEQFKDGEILPVNVKDMGSCEIYPQNISHSPNGRFVVVCGDGEYIIYTALNLRNKSFGAAQEFVWSSDSNEYAVRENLTNIKIFKNFKERQSFKPEFGSDGIFGGTMLGVKSVAGLAFYEWESLELIRRIEIQPKAVYWSDGGDMLCIATEESYFILKYNSERVDQIKLNSTDETVTEDGYEDAFEVIGEVDEQVRTGLWLGDCFLYTNAINRLNYYVGGEIVTVAHLDRVMYLLGYLPKENRLYLGDKELNIISYQLLQPVLDYQTCVMRHDFDAADKILPNIPGEQKTRVAQFLEKQGFKKQALHVSEDKDHQFDLSLQIGDTGKAYKLAEELESDSKWKQLAELAINHSDFTLAEKCLRKANDHAGLLLLSSCTGDAQMVTRLATDTQAKGINNISFISYFIAGEVDKALDLLLETGRVPEAAFFARTYAPSRVSSITKLWKEFLTKDSVKSGGGDSLAAQVGTGGERNKKNAQALADPEEYENLFPYFQDALKAEEVLRVERGHGRAKASDYLNVPLPEERDPIEELTGGVGATGTSGTGGASETGHRARVRSTSSGSKGQRSSVGNELEVDNIDELEGVEQDMDDLELEDDEEEQWNTPTD